MSNCSVCDCVIKSKRIGKKYCSNACKQRAYYARKHSVLTPTNKQSPFDLYKMVKERLGSDYDHSFMEFLFIQSCNPFITELDDLVLIVKDSIDNSYDFHGKIKPVYSQGLETFTKKWFEKGVGRLG